MTVDQQLYIRPHRLAHRRVVRGRLSRSPVIFIRIEAVAVARQRAAFERGIACFDQSSRLRGAFLRGRAVKMRVHRHPVAKFPTQ